MTNPVLIYLVSVYQEAIPVVAFMILTDISVRIIRNAFAKGELSIF